MPTISVIISIYNAEAYLDRCLESLRQQTYSDFEALLVNDGSTDGSGALCDRWAAEDPRFRVFHQENTGQAIARNRMLDKAQGEYIAFLDSDDYLHPRSYEILLDNLLTHNAKISIGGLRIVTGYLPSVILKDWSVTVWGGKSFLRYCLLNDVKDKSWVLWDKIFHKSCFDGIRMPEGRIYEDNAVVYKILYQADRVADCDAPLYSYFQNPEGTVLRPFTLKHLDWLTVLEEMIRFFEEQGEEELLQKTNKSYLFALAELHKKTRKAFGRCPEDKILKRKLLQQYQTERKKYAITIQSHPWLYNELYPLYACFYWTWRGLKGRFKNGNS